MKSRNFSEALQGFNRIREINPDDNVASLYIKRCEKLLKYGIPEEWTGVESLDEK